MTRSQTASCGEGEAPRSRICSNCLCGRRLAVAAVLLHWLDRTRTYAVVKHLGEGGLTNPKGLFSADGISAQH